MKGILTPVLFSVFLFCLSLYFSTKIALRLTFNFVLCLLLGNEARVFNPLRELYVQLQKLILSLVLSGVQEKRI